MSNNGTPEFIDFEAVIAAYDKDAGFIQVLRDVNQIVVDRSDAGLYLGWRDFYTWAYDCSRKAEWFDKNSDTIESRLSNLVNENQQQKQMLDQAAALLGQELEDMKHRRSFISPSMLALYVLLGVYLSLYFAAGGPAWVIIAIASGFISSTVVDWLGNLWRKRQAQKEDQPQ